jgi:NADPH:quinone reductase-like Zn-dependent oxidoreductase
MDWLLTESTLASGQTPQPGFGHEPAGVVSKIGERVECFADASASTAGALRAVADYPVGSSAARPLLPMPQGISDEVVRTLLIAGHTADTALNAIGLRPPHRPDRRGRWAA